MIEILFARKTDVDQAISDLETEIANAVSAALIAPIVVYGPAPSLGNPGTLTDSTTISWQLGATVKANVVSNSIDFAKLQTIPTNSLLGRDTAGTGNVESILLNSTLELDGTNNLQRAALTGDVTAAAGSNSTTIPTGSITFAKLANISTDSLIGRDTAGSGSPETISLNATLSFTGTGSIQREALTGDITASAGSNATTIANLAVTFAKMQNIATDSLIGRDTAGTGSPENILLNATLSMDGSGHLQRAALTGDVTASDGSNATTIANGAVTNAKLANVSTATFKGRTTAGTGSPEDLTATQATALLDVFIPDFIGNPGVKGLVPASASGDALAHKFLCATGLWENLGAVGANGNILYNNGGVLAGALNISGTNRDILTIGTGCCGTAGKLLLHGSTNGNVTQTAQAVAGSPTITWGTGSGTPVVTVSTPHQIDAAGNLRMFGRGFSAYLNANQTGIVDSTFTKIAYNAEVFDDNGNFASGTWTPPAGLITLSAAYLASGSLNTGGVVGIEVYKNGVNFKQATTASTDQAVGSADITIVDRANGTDTYEIYCFIDVTSGTATLLGEAAGTHTWVMGYWIGS